MALVIDVGLSRKAARDFQSAGVSLNIRAELDQGLLGRPHELQDAIARMYREVEEAVQQQTSRMNAPPPPESPEFPHSPGSSDSPESRNTPAPGDRRGGREMRHGGPALRHGDRYNHGNGNGDHRGNGHGSLATESQIKAIRAIARRLDIDPELESRHELGVDLDQLTVPEASKLIDHLKRLQSANHGGSSRSNDQGNGRGDGGGR